MLYNNIMYVRVYITIYYLQAKYVLKTILEKQKMS